MNELTVKEMNQKEALVKKYNTALSKCEKATWDVAKVIYETVNHPEFKKLFGTKKEYAKEIGLSQATVSKMESAYGRKLLLADDYSATQIAEMGKIEDDCLTDFVEVENVSVEDTCKEIREKANDYIKKLSPDEVEEVTEEEATEEEETEEISFSFKAYIDSDLEITNGDYIIDKKTFNEIMKLLGHPELVKIEK